MAVRSAERQALAEAIARHQAAADRLRRVREALAKAQPARVDRRIALDGAEEKLEEARVADKRRRVAVLLGEQPAQRPPRLTDVEDAAIAARREYELACRSQDMLTAEIPKIEQQVGFAKAEVDRALPAVIGGDPGLGRLLEEYDRARARAAELARVLTFIPVRLPGYAQHWDAVNRPLGPIEPILPKWQAAIEQLEAGAVDVQLPLVPAI